MNSHPCQVPLVDLAWQRDRVQHEVQASFADVLKRTAFIGGPDVAAFERAFADYTGVRHCVGVGNGTDALELALRAVGTGAGDECVLPANTFVGTAEAVHRTGAKPVLVDIDPATYLMDTKAAVAALSDRTAAVLPVHLYGRLADVTTLREEARRRGIMVVEDAAQAHGAFRDGTHAGSCGDLAATSFYPGKNLGAYGDGGAVLTNSDDLAERVRLLRCHGERVRHCHDIVGFNSRLDPLQAVVLSAKLARLDEWNALRARAVRNYDDLLAELSTVVKPEIDVPGHAWHLYVVRVPNRDEVLAGLHAQGIAAAVHYPVPIHRTGAFAHLGHPAGSFPEAERASREILSLPLFPGITEKQQVVVVEALRKLVP